MTGGRGPHLRGLLLAIGLCCLLPGCAGKAEPRPGAPPHVLQGGFRNTNPDFASSPAWDRFAFILGHIWTSTFNPRIAHLPRVENDGAALRANQTETTVTWVGHSTLLVQIDGINILTDPQWSDHASPLPFGGPRRVMPPGLRVEQLPPIHLVLISHDHYDHLDLETVRLLDIAHHPLFVVPLGVKAWFEEQGISQVEELDWWGSLPVRGLTITCLPAQHFSGRTMWDRNKRLWSGWAVAGRTKRLFFAGDTGYYDVFKEIGRRLGPFDLAAIPIGAYLPEPVMRMVHLTPEQALQVFADVQGRRFVAMHWGTFDLTEEPIEEPPQRLEAEAGRLGLEPATIWVLKHGETRKW